MLLLVYLRLYFPKLNLLNDLPIFWIRLVYNFWACLWAKLINIVTYIGLDLELNYNVMLKIRTNCTSFRFRN